MKTKTGLAIAVVALIALSAAYSQPPDVLPPPSAPAPAPAISSFPPAAPSYAPAAPCPSVSECPPRKKLFHGRLRERIKAIFHWGECP
ncbi:MAG TPA: hypothetical protein VMS17_30785 [Gemmataceae bacterium]|nr:hypothetical protein [Gemmataceae bacterium]